MRCWAEINLAALRHNAQFAAERTGTAVMAIIKANAYGHGDADVARALAGTHPLLPAGAKTLVASFGVANIAEAIRVREAVADLPILILGPALPEEREEIVRHEFDVVACSRSEIAEYAEIGQRLGKAARLHLAIDTGMGRIGLWHEETQEIAAILSAYRPLLCAVATHLPSADEDSAFTNTQLATFRAFLTRVDVGQIPVHILNSAGILRHPNHARSFVRQGLAIYGSSPVQDGEKLQAALTWKARITEIRTIGPNRTISYGRTFRSTREMRVATLPIGYADGYLRSLAGKAEVLIGGARCAVLGRITMDQIIVDVSAVSHTTTGDEAVLLGTQGAENISVGELADRAGTIAWEIFTGIGGRVRRIYHHDVSSSLQ